MNFVCLVEGRKGMGEREKTHKIENTNYNDNNISNISRITIMK